MLSQSTISFVLRLVTEKTGSFLFLYMNWMVNPSVCVRQFSSNQTKSNKHNMREWYLTKSLWFGWKIETIKSCNLLFGTPLTRHGLRAQNLY